MPAWTHLKLSRSLDLRAVHAWRAAHCHALVERHVGVGHSGVTAGRSVPWTKWEAVEQAEDFVRYALPGKIGREFHDDGIVAEQMLDFPVSGRVMPINAPRR